jgi:sugar lactone lactonase YvrE
VGANLWRYSLSGEILDFISLKDVKASIREIGGLCYDPVNDWLWVTDSEAHALFVFSGDARTFYGNYKLSSSYNNESVCVDHARGCVWVGDDNDDQPRIIRLDMEGLTLQQ